MPGPIGESCCNCYWWDLDCKHIIKEKDKNKKQFYYADCCFGDPGSKSEIKEMREDLFCSEFVNREYGIANFNKLNEDDSNDEDEE